MFAFASVGSGRWKAKRFRSVAYRGTKEVAARQSRLPTEAGASAPFTTRDERVRREASRAGAKSAQAGRGTEHPLVPVVWWMRLERFFSAKLPLRRHSPTAYRVRFGADILRHSIVVILRRAERFPVRLLLVREHWDGLSAHLFQRRLTSGSPKEGGSNRPERIRPGFQSD